MLAIFFHGLFWYVDQGGVCIRKPLYKECIWSVFNGYGRSCVFLDENLFWRFYHNQVKYRQMIVCLSVFHWYVWWDVHFCRRFSRTLNRYDFQGSILIFWKMIAGWRGGVINVGDSLGLKWEILDVQWYLWVSWFDGVKAGGCGIEEVSIFCYCSKGYAGQ